MAPRERRVELVVGRSRMTARDALHEIDSVDRHRAEFVRRVFGRSMDDPLAYDVVLNAAQDEAAAIAGWLEAASIEKFKRIRPLETSPS
jgi:cytidylate kinase